MHKIFISIASYRDPLLKTTITEAYKNARHPERLVFGIVDQSYDREFINIDHLDFRKQIRYFRIDPYMTRGCCFSRNLCQSLWAGEELYFQCDSHTLFDQDWDYIFEEEFKRLSEWHDRPAITAYPRGFKVIDNDIKKLERQTISGCMTLAVDEAQTFKNNYFVGTIAKVMQFIDTVPGFLMSANCLFTWGKICEEVPYDPYLFFHGEEHSLALRMWTSGYSIFHMPLTPVYHHYGRDYRTTYWGDQEQEQQRDMLWHERDQISKRRLEGVVRGAWGGQYGIGRVKSIHDYIRYTGIDYFKQTVEPKSLTGAGIFDRDWRKAQY